MGSPCDLLLAELDKGLSSVTGIKDGLMVQVDGMMKSLDDVVALPIDDITDAAAEVQSSVIDGAQEAGDSLDATAGGADCGIVGECMDGLMSQINDMVSIDLPSIPSLPDIPGLNDAMGAVDGFCNNLNAFAGELVSFGLGSIITKLDKYINCLESSPDGPSTEALQERMDKLTGVTDDLMLDDMGEIDMDTIYNGVDSSVRDATSMVSNTKTEAVSAVKSKASSILPSTKKSLPVAFL